MFKNLIKNKELEHKHSWVLIAKTYSEPIRAELLGQIGINISSDILKYLSGFTTLFFECSCGQHKKEELPGSEGVTDNNYEETFAKVETEGPQVLTTPSGSQFLIGKYVPTDIIKVR